MELTGTQLAMCAPLTMLLLHYNSELSCKIKTISVLYRKGLLIPALNENFASQDPYKKT